jgi:hypothetical protein
MIGAQNGEARRCVSGPKEGVMMMQTAPGQAGATTEGPAGPGPARKARQPGRLDGTVRKGVWLVVAVRGLGDRRFLTSVITSVLGAYALASVIKNNQAQPVRRAIHWYNVKGEVHDMKALHDARQTLKQDKG